MLCTKCLEHKWPDPQKAIFSDNEQQRFCIFHAPTEHKGDRSEEFLNNLMQRINCYTEHNLTCSIREQKTCCLRGTIFTETIDFEGQQLPKIDFRYSTFNEETYFINTLFTDTTDFSGVTFQKTSIFNGAEFYDTSKFTHAKFYEYADFDSSIFYGSAHFRSTIFTFYATFTSSKFKSHSTFTSAKFTSSCNFMHTEFYGKLSFSNTIVRGDVIFVHSIFHSDVVFKGSNLCSRHVNATSFDNATSTFNSEIDFTGVTLSGKFSADGANFNGKIKFDLLRFPAKSSFIQTNLGQASFRLCKFKEAPIFDRCDLRKVEFIGAPVEDFRLMACVWPESHGRCITYDARKNGKYGYFKLTNINTTPLKTENDSETAPPIRHLEDLYRRLKKVARSEMDEPLASDFHYAEKEMQRLRGLKQWHNHEECRHHPNTPLPFIEELRGFGLCTTLLCYKLSSGYGEAPGRAALCLLLLAIAVPLIGLSLPPAWCPDALATQLHIYGTSTGDKWLHFLPLVKLPDADTAGWLARLLMLLSQVAITLQAALFGFALRNRFRR